MSLVIQYFRLDIYHTTIISFSVELNPLNIVAFIQCGISGIKTRMYSREKTTISHLLVLPQGFHSTYGLMKSP